MTSQSNPNEGNKETPIGHVAVADPHVYLSTRSTKVYRNSLRYTCQFRLKSGMLEYYYTPPPSDFCAGQPVLHGSSEFEGPWNTKWQVTTTFNRWIDVHRWMSLYLTRTDNVHVPMQLQCEFRIVNKNKEILKSMRSLLSPTQPQTTRGFSKFLPFSEVKKMIDDENVMRVEAHVEFICGLRPPEYVGQNQMDFKNIELFSTNLERNVPSPASRELIINEEDKLRIYMEDKFISVASGTEIFRSSKKYQAYFMKQNGIVPPEIRLSQVQGKPTEEVVLQVLEHTHWGSCTYFKSGTYDDILGMLNLADDLKMETLMGDCFREMIARVTTNNAALLALMIRGNINLVMDEDKEIFHKYFTDYFRDIRKTEEFKTLTAAEDMADYFVRLVVDPKFSIYTMDVETAQDDNEDSNEFMELD